MYCATVSGLVGNTHALGLDGDTPFLLQFHAVQVLVLLLAIGDEARLFHDPVGQSGLAVINVSDDAEISDVVLFGHMSLTREARPRVHYGYKRFLIFDFP